MGVRCDVGGDFVKKSPHQARVVGGGRKLLSETLKELMYEEFVIKRTKKEKEMRSWLASMVITLVEVAGFANKLADGFIAKHDVYGAKFRDK
ncbi:hypothetical protein KRP22_002521 [Phytophthora ramorum]|nr:hypothetical protein KRP22_6169 [Phytophthora ramorum]